MRERNALTRNVMAHTADLIARLIANPILLRKLSATTMGLMTILTNLNVVMRSVTANKTANFILLS